VEQFLVGERRVLAMVAALVLAAAGMVVTMPGKAEALTQSRDCLYYHNTAYSQVVGERAYDCNGHLVVSWGSVTAFSECTYEPCP